MKKFKFLVCLVLAVMASINSVQAAPSYFCVEIIPVLDEGAAGVVFACDNSSANSKYNNYYYNIGKDGLWTTHFDATIERLSGGKPNFYIMAQPGNQKTMFDGWYWDAACTERLSSSSSGINTFCKVTVSGNGRTLTSYPSAAEAEAGTKIIIYAKFVKLTPDFDWSTKAATPADDGKYYIYNSATGRFLKAPKGSVSSSNKPATTTNPSEATLFTCDVTGSGTKNTYYDNYGVKENRSYTICSFAYNDNGTTKYAKADSYSWGTSKTNIYVWSWASLEEKTFMLTKADATGSDFSYALETFLNGDVDYPTPSGDLKRNSGLYWMFIPESAFDEVAQVNSLNENGAVTITDSPTASGTANVTFNVAAGSTPSAFDVELSGADKSNWVKGTPTCSDGILSIPVTYTAKNKHYTSTSASTVTVTVTAKNAGASTASGTASAYTDFEPRFALTVDALDWSHVGEEVVETYYSGQEIAASERDRLADKLVYAPAQTTGVAANHATWTATIIGTNADQFKFANGTREVSGLYTASLLDVHYAPTTTGNHEATLHIVTSYTDVASHTETYEKNITLRGVGSAASRITFAKAGNQLPTNAESHNFGEIIGTNHLDITADLFISQITSPQMVWSDPAGQFEFDESSVDFSQLNQTLTFRAHRTSPVTENTVHTATLTVSGKGTANEDVSATITLTYTATPLIPTTVTWNWATINENTTVNNPITTNSDGVWILEKAAGDAITYNEATKTATAAYLHHEPGKTAEFVLHIPQTDTYTAFDAEYEASILAPTPEDVFIDSQTKLDAHVEYTRWEKWEDAAYGARTLYVDNDKVYILIEGQNVLEFDFSWKPGSSYSNPKWYVSEIWDDGTEHKILNYEVFTVGHKKYTLSPRTVKFYVKGYGVLKDIHYYEYDVIEADKEQVALIYDNGAISSRDINTTFANKQQVTASLNATAAQYFEIRSEGKTTGSSMIFDSNDGLGVGASQDRLFTIALKAGANATSARQAAVGNACQLIFSDDYTYNHEELVLPIVVIEPCEITYKHSANGSYTVTYQNDEVAHVVSGADYIKSVSTTNPADYVVTLNAPTPASGYMFQGWKISNTVVSCKEAFTTSVGADGSVVEAAFVPMETQNFKVGDVYFADLSAALNVAETSSDSKVVTLMQDVTLGDGTTPMSYTIPAGITLLIPHKADFFELQLTPELVVNTQQVLSAYRTLTLTEGVTINCNGNICVAAKMLTAGGGQKSAYPTGEVGVINMTSGGHIELNDGANLYCWGYIKGQDMDQGNNTQDVGTVTANAGSVVWENFELGDWRGGSASLDIYNNNVIDHRKLFPFQSYAIQNVEVPTSFKYGAVLRNFTSITTGMGDHGAVFSMIGPSETMFLLTDEQSMVRTWYDPTTDLTCYELSGTAQLDALHITVYVSMSSEDFILPICNSMHIILKDCNMTLSNPLMMQAGSIIEIKPTGTVNLENELYMYDKDQWGKYAHNYYFRSFNNLTSHKDRGAEDSKEGLDDAKLIVDGMLNVQNGGKIYTTAGGANVMGNGGGELHFKQALPGPERLWAVRVIGELPYIKWEYNDATAANLCNEDGSYTRSLENAAFYNIHGRWFHEEDKEVQEDHTYFFTYMEGENIGQENENRNAGEDAYTAAVYSNDKTGLEARMKWFNVVEDENCPNWWIGTNPAAQYNYTMLNDWNQFVTTETPSVYSGSDNKLYGKDECSWSEMGSVDENCLYTFIENEQEVKKALVNGHFIPLESNGYDPAYHATANASQYYICFTGCNWHPATPYTGESKAYTIHPEDEDLHYIWFNNDWMNVQRDEPFFYTEDEQTNVRTYYEYVNGDWVVATPYVSVTDDAEERNFYMIKEAFNVAQIKKNVTIKLLRDLPNVAEVLSYETQNTTCTLDLNGHLLGGALTNLITVNAPGATFTITDNSDLKIGKISNAANKAVYVTKGTLVVANGTIESTGANAIACASAGAITINGGYLSAATKCVNAAGSACTINGGYFTDNTSLATYCAAHKYPFETADPKYKYEVSAAWTITFVNEATSLQTLHVKPGETPVYTAAQPTKDGYKFTGWDPAITIASADATYTAQFAVKAAEEHCITLNSNGGKEGLQYVYVTSGSAVGELPVATKEGHEFTGWYSVSAATGGTQLEATTDNIDADVTYYARYSKNSYTLTWEANGGELSGGTQAGQVQFGTTITAPTATKTGHTFLCWNTPVTTMPAHDVTYTAQWSVAAKHYLQNLDGTYPAAPAATDDVTGAAGEYVTPAVKTFDGFITPATQTVKIGETDVVTYNYARRAYTITWDANGGSCATASTNVKHGAAAVLPEATRDDYELDGWFTKAVGGDRITASTEILRNIGTLYAHWTEIVNTVTEVIAEDGESVTIDDDHITAQGTNQVTNLIIENGGTVTVTANIMVDNLYLEGEDATSGQLFAAANKVTATNAYYDHVFNETVRHWRAFGVPWMVNLDATPIKEVKNQTGNPVSRTLVLGSDYDIIYYNGAKRAAEGPGTQCWEFVKDGSHILQPGKCYMIAFNSNVGTLRFAKSYGSPVVFTGTMNVAANTASDAANSGINAIANPMCYHTTMNAGPTTAQVHNGGLIGEDDYILYNIEDKKFVVGKAVYVQVGTAQPVVINPAGSEGVITPAAAPKRREQAVTEKRYLSLDDYYNIAIQGANETRAGHLYVLPEEDKADEYIIGHDLTKMGMSASASQIWVKRYGVNLCMHTAAPVDGVTEFPVNIYAPAAGEYTITNDQSPITDDNYTVYLTRDGRAVWNLSLGACTLSLEKGTSTRYGLRVTAKAPQVATGMDEALVDAQGDTRKVLINDQVYVIRGDKVYTIDGQLVK